MRFATVHGTAVGTLVNSRMHVRGRGLLLSRVARYEAVEFGPVSCQENVH